MRSFLIATLCVVLAGCGTAQRSRVAQCQGRANALNVQYSLEMTLRCRAWLKAGQYALCPDYDEIETRYASLYDQEADKC